MEDMTISARRRGRPTGQCTSEMTRASYRAASCLINNLGQSRTVRGRMASWMAEEAKRLGLGTCTMNVCESVIYAMQNAPAYRECYPLIAKAWNDGHPSTDGEERKDIGVKAKFFVDKAWTLGLGMKQTVVADCLLYMFRNHPRFSSYIASMEDGWERTSKEGEDGTCR